MLKAFTWRFWNRPRHAAVPNLVAPRWNHAVVFLQLALNAIVGYGFARMLANMYGISAAKDGFDIAYSTKITMRHVSQLLGIT